VEISVEPKPFHELHYLNASRRGRAEVARLPFFRGRMPLPSGCDALVLASDLQGMASPAWAEPAALLGVAVARAIDELDLGRVGAILAGDLYSVPEANKRGGFGDVSSVWDAFAEFCVFVAGVAGNHDDVSRVATSSRVRLLDGDVVTSGQLRIGGVSYVVGNEEKKGRRSEQTQLEKLRAAKDADILVLHEGPFIDDEHDGSAAIRDALVDASVPLVVCGHRPWSSTLVRLSEHTQILNVHERVLVTQAIKQ
jgi:hypothetical protein